MNDTRFKRIHDTLAERLRRLVPAWRHAALTITPLAGGITNTNFRVDVDGVPHVVRVESPATLGLAIHRGNEWHNTAQAAVLGVAPRVLHRFEDEHLSVREYLDARTLSAAELRSRGNPARLGRLLRGLHDAATFRGEFDLVRAAEGYGRHIESAGYPTPADYAARTSALSLLAEALGPRPARLAACHNDLLAENILDDGQNWRLIDFEYSGNNDPCFELGNLCRELDFGACELEELCRAYFGSLDEGQLARVRTQMLVSDVGWSLWAVLQEHASSVEFDYAAYGTRRWQRAAQVLESAEFARWLTVLRANR